MSVLRKIVVMALLGALGAALGAAVGEPLFGEAAPARSVPRRICLLFDVSGSMGDLVTRESGTVTQIQALKEAASDFVIRQDLAVDGVGLAVFASDAQAVQKLGHDATQLVAAINGLHASGGTNLGRGLDVAATVLRYREGEPWVLVFTDGKPETSSSHETPEGAALSAATRLREAGVNIVAIGTGLADAALLAQVTGSPERVIISDPRKLQESCQRSEAIITRQMLATTGVTSNFARNAGLTGAWAALIAIGASLGLLIGQNRHTHRKPLTTGNVTIVAIGGIITGVTFGAVGQSLYFALAEVKPLAEGARLVAWTLLGCGIGFGMGSFVPNLPRHRAAVAGAAGGIVAVVGFLLFAPIVGDAFSRLLGAAIMGLSIGLMMVLVEVATRNAFLVVHWSAKERSTLSLGSKPILVGSSSEAHILIAEDVSPEPIAASIWIEDGVMSMQVRNSITALNVGQELTFGRIRIEVRGDSGAVASMDPAVADRVEPARPRETVRSR